MKPSQDTLERANDEGCGGMIDWETDVTTARKQQQPNFKLLQRLWAGSGDREILPQKAHTGLGFAGCA
jgi:hypothetical protein